MTFFDRLDEARLRRGHTVEQACEAMRISVPAWYKWRGGNDPSPFYREAAERYIAKAEGRASE